MKFMKNNIKDIQLINLTEARRHPNQNPKISAYDALKPYSESKEHFISFTSIDKLGINPKSRFNTPLGIYCYPLKEIWKVYDIEDEKSVGGAVPYAGDNPYIWLIKVKRSSNFINNMYSDYDSRNYDDDMLLLKEDVLNNKGNYSNLYIRASLELDIKDIDKSDLNLQEWVEDRFQRWTEAAKERNPIMSMWNVTKNLAGYKKGKASMQWNVLLRKVLGYDGFADRSGKGYIHPSEPVQAVFLSKSAFEIEGEFLNKDYEDPNAMPLWLTFASIDDENSRFTFKGKKFIWYYGTWNCGVWEYGTWENGEWKYGTWIKGRWWNGLWKDGTWENGIWKLGVWKQGTWEDGIWKDGKWENGIWKNGEWRDGLWKDGIWENGLWENGTWEEGTWKDGIWSNGTWKSGTWEKGTWVEGSIYDPELNEYIDSSVSPKKYFERKKTIK